MYIVSTNESLFDKEDIYESLIAHCGLEYASSVFRLLGANKEFEFNKKQSQIDALEQELDSYTMDLYRKYTQYACTIDITKNNP